MEDRRYASRKFRLVLILTAMITTGFGFGMVAADLWVGALLVLGLTYMAGNVGDTLAEAVKGRQ